MDARETIRLALRGRLLSAGILPTGAGMHLDGEPFTEDPSADYVREKLRPATSVLVELPAEGGTLEHGGLYLLNFCATAARDPGDPYTPSAAGDAFAAALARVFPHGMQFAVGEGEARVGVTILEAFSSGGDLNPESGRYETPCTVRWTAETINRSTT